MSKRAFWGAILCVSAAATAASADYQGPRGNETQATVRAILDNPKDDSWVVLRGFIIRQTAGDRYIFSDGTGEIAIEVEKKSDKKGRGMPDQPLDDKTKVEISGEVDKDFRKAVEIDVDRVEVVTE